MEFYHPNSGWQSITAECDARNFQILLDWPVRTSIYAIEQSDFKLFQVVIDTDKSQLCEVTTSEVLSQGHRFIVGLSPLKDGKDYIQRTQEILIPQVELFKVCPSSDPKDLPMPLSTRGNWLWLFPVPEEVFGVTGIYIRIKVPKIK